jgi:hypothetical protein
MPTIAAWNGNSGIPPLLLVELETEVVALKTELVELEDVVVAVVVLWLPVVLAPLDMLELVDVTTDGAYWKVAVAFTCGGYAPQVAFTVYVPPTHAEVPPATKV